MAGPLSIRLLAWCVIALLALFPDSLQGGTLHAASTSEPRELTHLEPHFRESVLKGWRFFQTSYAKDGIACVHCHRDHSDIRKWAGAYPKVEPFDGTLYRVKTLEEVVSFALLKHTDLKRSEVASLVNDIVSYISYWGYGTTIAPGRSESFSPPAQDMALLRLSALRGKKLFADHCRVCHNMTSGDKGPPLKNVIESITRFPRFVPEREKTLSLVGYLSWHVGVKGERQRSLTRQGITDISAYLKGETRGLILYPGTLEKRKGGR